MTFTPFLGDLSMLSHSFDLSFRIFLINSR